MAEDKIDINKQLHQCTPITETNRKIGVHTSCATNSGSQNGAILLSYLSNDVGHCSIKNFTEINDNVKKLSLFTTPDVETKINIYWTRFWILGVFSFVVFNEFIVWGTFGPIMKSAEYAYNWSDGYIALLGAWGPINSVVFMVPLSWFNQKYGLKKGVFITAFLITLGTAARCITTDDTIFTYLASFGAITVGMSSSLTQSLPAMISSTWFPPNERTTATAIGLLMGQLAMAAMYLSPLIVRDPSLDDQLSRDDIKGDIRVLMFIHFGMSLAALLCVVAYYPASPAQPPSISSTKERVDYFKSVKTLLRNYNFVLIMVTYVFVYSFPIMWFTVMNFSLKCIGIEQDQSMYIAITASLSAVFAALVAARLTDCLQGHMKVTIACLVFAASGFFIWFLLITEKVLVYSSNVPVFIAIAGGISMSYAAVPIIIEFAVELAYPCPESAVGAIAIFFMDFTGIIFLLLMIIPSECYRWLSYVLAIGVISTIFPILLVKEDRKRAAIDAGSTPAS